MLRNFGLICVVFIKVVRKPLKSFKEDEVNLYFENII